MLTLLFPIELATKFLFIATLVFGFVFFALCYHWSTGPKETKQPKPAFFTSILYTFNFFVRGFLFILAVYLIFTVINALLSFISGSFSL